MLRQDEDIQFLLQIGFTATQAKLYLSLLKLRRTDVKTLAKDTNVPRQTTYRVLGELQEKGICEKIMALPQEYEAIPIKEGISIMLNEKANEYAKSLKKTQEFLLRFSMPKETPIKEQECKMRFIEGKKTFINKMKIIHTNLQNDAMGCSTLQLWVQITQEIFQDVENALDRGVSFRFVIEKPNGEISLPNEIESLMTNPNFQVRLTCNQLKLRGAVYDSKEASFNFDPSKSLSESHMIWTNHPGLVISFQDHFENLWTTAQRYNFQKQTV